MLPQSTPLYAYAWHTEAPQEVFSVTVVGWVPRDDDDETMGYRPVVSALSDASHDELIGGSTPAAWPLTDSFCLWSTTERPTQNGRRRMAEVHGGADEVRLTRDEWMNEQMREYQKLKDEINGCEPA
jgi:hypothetical protein